jgi:hypothetical protein
VPLSSSAAVVDIGKLKIGPVATKLDVIAVEAEEVRLFPQLADFYRRKQQGMTGDFFTREEIVKTGARQTSAVVSRTAKVAMDCPHDAVKAGSPDCVARDRRGMRASYGIFQPGAGGCEKQLFLDGKRYTGAIDDVPVDELAALEIYAGPATTPANFGAPPCGVIAIWTIGAQKR